MTKKYSAEQFINKSNDLYGYCLYDYSEVDYISSSTKVRILCKDHGVFYKTPNKHLQGQGCPICSKLLQNDKSRCTLDKFVETATAVHGKYDYSLVKYVSSRTPIMITCKHHGVFQQTPAMHLGGQGCPACANEANAQRQLLNTDIFVKQAKIVHGNRYSYDLVEYEGCQSYVKILCKEHGVFKQWPNSHLSGRGCPHCSDFGFDKTIPAFLYVFDITGVFNFTGFGISKDHQQRKIAHRVNLKKHGCLIEKEHFFSFVEGKFAQELETLLKQTFPLATCSKDIHGFKTESTSVDYPTVVAFVQNYINTNKEPHGDTRLN